MLDIKAELIASFDAAGAAPFLFIGSGFSRRYLNLEDWPTLLRRFSAGLKDFEYYLTSANGDLPTVASLIAENFHDYWWHDEKFAASREKNKTKLKDKTSALRIEICNYLNDIAQAGFTDTAFPEEIAVLSRLNVEGIITTNWDTFIEKLFPDYRVYVGQKELLFSHPQSIAEIYKIHGSSQRPSSLVLTRGDYDAFEEKNPYLASKLITIFVEHPIVFIGYSLSDKNITSLLSAIVSCLGGENLDKLRDSLFFVQRAHEEEASYSKTIMSIEGIQLPITIIKTNDFLPVYEALDATKRKIPARVLRFCKEQLYELVKSSSPENKISVIDIDNIERSKDVEFVVGVGVATSSEQTSHYGYQGLTAIDLFKDLILEEERNLDAQKVIEATIPLLSKNCKYLPVYKYLRELGIGSLEEYKKGKCCIDRYIEQTPEYYKGSLYVKQYISTEKDKSIEALINTNPPEKAAIFLPFLPKEKFDLGVVREFLAENIDKLDNANSNYATYFRKAACLYDYYRFGWSVI